MMKRILAACAGLFALALPGAALAQCSGIFTSGYFCGNSAAGGGLAAAASPTAMFDRAFGGTNNSTVVRIGGVWTVLSSANNGVWITSAAGVPSIGATLPNAVQDNITRVGTLASGAIPGSLLTGTIASAVQDNITRLGTIVSGTWTGTAIGATFGGTGQTSYAVGDILYAPTTTTVGKLADVATGNAVISGGVGVPPSYGKIGLTTHVSGQLPLANGGCNGTTAATCLNNIMPTPTRAGDVAYWNGSAWTTLAGNNSGTNVLTENSSGVLSWSAPGTGTVTNFSAGNLSPLFTSSVATSTTTPALTFALSNATDKTLYSNVSGGSAAPQFNNAATVGASRVLLQSQTASASTTIDFVNGVSGAVLDSTYDRYEIDLINVYPATNGQALLMRIGTGGTPTWQSGAGAYQWGIYGGVTSSATPSGSASNSATEMQISGAVSNDTVRVLNGTVTFSRPSASTVNPIMWNTVASDGTSLQIFNGGGAYVSTTAITGIRFFFTGNTASGTYILYGIRKS
jgi:hypothetical protein